MSLVSHTRHFTEPVNAYVMRSYVSTLTTLAPNITHRTNIQKAAEKDKGFVAVLFRRILFYALRGVCYFEFTVFRARAIIGALAAKQQLRTPC